MTHEEARTVIGDHFNRAQVDGSAPLVVTVPVAEWCPFARFVKETLNCRFFSFSTVVDWKEQGLELVAKVDNVDTHLSLIIKTRLAPGVVECASLVPIYRGADWMERESFDMFGIRFDGHPDLRRILLGDGWDGHPLLKSYAVDTPQAPYR